MRKQVILVVGCLVFALALSGAVSAEETTVGVNESYTNTTGDGTDETNSISKGQLLNTVIKGQVLDCNTNEPFP